MVYARVDRRLVERAGKQAAARRAAKDALAYATKPAKLGHIFEPKHKLDPLVRRFGSEQAVMHEVLSSIEGLVPKAGIFGVATQIGGQTVIVRGAVVNGVVKIGTVFTP